MKFGAVLLILALAVPVAAQRRQQMDTNHDGKISRDEWKGPADSFDRLDSNHDGFITREERPQGNRRGSSGRFDPKSMDSNGDGRISKDEWKGQAEMFDRIDSNHDGVLTKEEIKNGRERRR